MKRGAGHHLLLVEDNDDHADLILALLKKNRNGAFRTSRVRSAQDGLSRATAEHFDLVLLDLSLPDSRPEDTLATYTSAIPNVPIVVLTSLADESLVQAAIDSGAQDYLDKSALRGDAVVRSIQYAIDRKRVLTRLEEQNDELKRFAHTVAHELKTPLQGVQTALHLMDESAPEGLQDSLREVLRLGLSSSKHMGNLVNELLAFAEADPGELVQDAVDMREVLADVIDSLQLTDGVDRDVFHVQDELPTVPGARPQLRQVLQNLLGNAVKYCGDDPLEVEIAARQEKGEWIFVVSDNGQGIAPEHHDRIFESFYRVPGGGAVTGTGIGLGFAKSVVERHGGRIWVESQPGAGSTFYFSLPAESGPVTK